MLAERIIDLETKELRERIKCILVEINYYFEYENYKKSQLFQQCIHMLLVIYKVLQNRDELTQEDQKNIEIFENYELTM